jgi:hypothetical protein
MLHTNRAGQQFRQLPMFMSAREIMDRYQPLDGDRDAVLGETDERLEDDGELYARKYDEAENTYPDWDVSLKDSILQHGVKNPVSLQADDYHVGSQDKPEILGGHHRVAVMGEHKPDTLMPVEHFESQWQAQSSLRDRY